VSTSLSTEFSSSSFTLNDADNLLGERRMAEEIDERSEESGDAGTPRRER